MNGEPTDIVNIEELLEFIEKNPWPTVAAAVIWLIVRLQKASWWPDTIKLFGKAIPFKVPPRWRPALAVMLGMLSAMGEMMSLGKPPLRAFLAGAISAVLPIIGNELVSEMLLGKRAKAKPVPELPPVG